MGTPQSIGKIARYIGAIYLLVAGLFSLVSEFVGLFSPNTSLFSIISPVVSLFINLFWLYAAYALFRNLRSKLAGIIGMLLFSSIVALSLNLYQKENITMFTTLGVVTVLIILIIFSWKMESRETNTSVDKARNTFGEHISHLSDKEVHKMLK